MIIQGDSEDNGFEPVAATGSLSQITGGAEVGAVHLASSDRVLPGVIARAANSGTPFSLVVARPGPAASPGHPTGTPSAGQVADLAAALSVSLGPSQELLEAGPHHLAVVVPGNPATGRRQAVLLMQRAAGAGAPLFTWAAARYPRDATTADRLVDVGRRRVDGVEVAGDRSIGAASGSGSHRRAGAIWAGVAAAAALVAALALGLHGSGGPARPGSGASGGGQPGTSSSGHPGGSVGGSADLSSGVGSTFPGSGSGSGQPGSHGSSSGSGGATGTSGGTPGGSQGTSGGTTGSGGGSGGSTTGGGGNSTGSGGTTPTGNGGNSGSGSGLVGGLTSDLGNTVSGVANTVSGAGNTVSGVGNTISGSGSTGSGLLGPGSGSTGSGTTGTSGTTSTGTTGTTGSGTNQCSGLLNTLTCTVNGVVGG
ncbi:MAG TPA: hypothetical protein DCQ30_07160 [Acidimicrobiaceae bacterium]|nr:hypothetical protein [Acidimicrobiaceae bacterium]